MNKTTLLATTALLTLAATTASAATYQHTVNNGIFGNGGTFDQLHTTYNTDTQQLTWSLTNGLIGSDAVTGFWLVLNDGPNPKTADVNELAILYADFNNDKLLAYTYNGLNSASSINNPGIMIHDYSANMIETGNTIGFSLDASIMNEFTHPSIVAADWKGMQYDDKLGIWFHVTTGYAITGDGQQTPYDFIRNQGGKQAWFDTSGDNPIETTVVPIPAAAFLFAPALVGLMGFRRKLAKS